MRVTIEVDSKSELEKLSALFKSLKISKIDVSNSNNDAISIVKGDKSIDPTGLFGIWSEKPRKIEDIRNSAWQRQNDR